MELNLKTIRLNQIAINPLNPRELDHSSETDRSQYSLIARTMDEEYANELLISMQQQVLWVNQIVVVDTDLFCAVHKNPAEDLSSFDYVVLEGNTRVCCLKSGRINDIYPTSSIPVVCIEFKEGVSKERLRDDFLKIQGICNVSAAKEWRDLAKVRHIYQMYSNKRNLGYKLEDAIQSVANVLGLTTDTVTGMLRSYNILECIGLVNNKSMEQNWMLLDIFPQSGYAREVLGISHHFTYARFLVAESFLLIKEILDMGMDQGLEIRKMRDYMHRFFEVNQCLGMDREVVLAQLYNVTEDNLHIGSFMQRFMDYECDNEICWIRRISKLIRDFPKISDEQEYSEEVFEKLDSLILAAQRVKERLSA
ncbi:hypothetical protein [Persicobacter psychrovividus]|uniref:Uncharacterized protein n=1 Tax=Persicobacter psychrovividus TaxID=387638 RepID=A0ABM7VN12_9BACT|nr:hypothetical protein PEPS_46680 [Persicobacter psychrovividus]